MENSQEDFVVNARGVKTWKVPPIVDFDGRKTRSTPEQVRERHNILRQLKSLVRASESSETTEKTLAEACGADMNSPVWLESIESLYSRGYLVPIRTVWDGLDKCDWVKLKDDERRVKLLAPGMYFAAMNFEQAMQIAGDR
jgi:hypothetical protein